MPQGRLITSADDIIWQVKNPEIFDHVITDRLGNGVEIRRGRLRGQSDDAFQIQSFTFTRPDWDEELVMDWLSLNQKQFAEDTSKMKTDEPKKDESPENSKTKSISGVEVFAVGTWNGDEYTAEDLDEMVRAFEENKAKLRPFLKLGHDPDQKLLQNDGLPAAGWVSDLKRVGDKLVADFSNIPKKIFELLKNGAYRKVSSEIYWNIKVGANTYRRFLSGVALLGSDLPALGGLDDILELYSKQDLESLKIYSKNKEYESIKSYDFSNDHKRKEKEMSDNAKLEAKLEARDEQIKKYEAADKARETADKEAAKKLEELEASNKQFKADSEKDKAAKEKAETEKFIEGLQVSKSMSPILFALLGEDKKEYKIEKKEFSKQDLVSELLKLHSANEDVNLDEDSDEGEKQDKSEVASEAKIQKYMTDNKVEYRAAYSAVMKQK